MAEVSPRGTSKVTSWRTAWVPKLLGDPLDGDDGVGDGHQRPLSFSGMFPRSSPTSPILLFSIIGLVEKADMVCRASKAEPGRWADWKPQADDCGGGRELRPARLGHDRVGPTVQ